MSRVSCGSCGKIITGMFQIGAAMLLIHCGGNGETPATDAGTETAPVARISSTLPTSENYSVVAVADGGVITGTITYGGVAPEPKPLVINNDLAVCGADGHMDESFLVGADNGIQNVIISLTDITSGKPMDALGSEFVLDQLGCVYTPHIVLVPAGIPLNVKNSDGILHNVHTYSTENPSKNLAQPKFKKEMDVLFERAERIPVRCDVHPWMVGYIQVVDHPYHVITDDAGRFTIDDVPPGTYTVEIWQEKLGRAMLSVTVSAGETTELNHEYPASNR